MNTIFLTISAITFYLLATLLLFLRTGRKAAAGEAPAPMLLFPAYIALLLHLLLLSQLVIGQDGLNLGFGDSLTLFAWLTTVISMLIALNMKLPALLQVMFPVAAVTIVCAVTLPAHPSPADNYSIALIIHVGLSLLAYGLLSIAALIAILLAIQDFQLHHHSQGALLKQLPPLQSLEALLFRLIEIGFALLCFSLISGFLFTDDWFSHKIVFSVIAWTVFLVLLLGRHIAGWRGQTAIRWTLAGIAALMLAIFGTKVVLEFILSR